MNTHAGGETGETGAPGESATSAASQSGDSQNAGRARFDAHQLAAISERRNAVVSAGAGSGKTAVLTERYCRLVAEERIAVDRILTLTFTRKAAAEMHERIYRRLAELDAPFVQEQLGRFDRAEISTLDSFCGRVVRSRAALFGVAPSFTVDEREHERVARRVALQFLGAYRDDGALTRFLADNGFEAVLENGLVRLAQEAITVARPVSFEETFHKQATRLFRAASEILQSMEEKRALVSEASAEGDAWLGAMQAALEELEIPAPQELEAVSERVAAGVLSLEQLHQSGRETSALLNPTLEFLGSIDLRRGSRSKEAVVNAKQELKVARDELRPKLRSICFSLSALEEQHRLFELLGEFQERVLAARRLSGVLTYHDVVVMAIELLRREPELRRFYKQQFDQIMIDEFQDNNQLQKELLYLLAEHRSLESDRIPGPAELMSDKLFFVGDAKQSIYRFRGADVSVFRGLSEELAEQSGVPLTLEANYRTDPGLVEFFNRTFDAVFPEPRELYEPQFLPIRPREPFGHSEPAHAKPSVTVAYLDNTAEPDPNDELDGPAAEASAEEAYYVARYLAEIVGEERLALNSRDGVRSLRYEDCAILLRSTGNQMQFERMLRLFGVPYTASGMRSLFLDAPAYDLYSVLQLCVHPEDREAYAAVLRSPFTGLSDHALLEVLLDDEPAFARRRFAAERDQERYEAAAARLAELQRLADRVPVETLLETVWFDHGYRYTVLKSTAHHAYLEYYRYLFELAATPPGQTLEEFLVRMRENLGEFKRLAELDVLLEEQTGVRIMSIHAAKGLEFPVVVLADAGNTGRGNHPGGRPYYASDEYGVCVNLKPAPDEERVSNYFYLEGKDEEDRKADAELRRLLYVALTRAEAHLLVSGVLHRNNRKPESCHLSMLLSALGIDASAPGAASPPGAAPELPQAVRFCLEAIEPVGDRAMREGGRRRAGRTHLKALESDALRLFARDPVRYEWSATELNALFVTLESRASSESVAVQGQLFAEAGQPEHSEQADDPSEQLACDRLLTSELRRTEFGTLVHRVIEQRLNRYRESGEYRSEGPGAYLGLVGTRLRDALSEGELELLASDALRLAGVFEDSALGRECYAAASVESELAFTMPLEGLDRPAWVHGQIDLLAAARRGESNAGGGDRRRGADTALVIDFKTDKDLRPEQYRLQLALYLAAAESIVGGEVRSCLFELRSGRAIELDELPAVRQAVLRLKRAGLA